MSPYLAGCSGWTTSGPRRAVCALRLVAVFSEEIEAGVLGMGDACVSAVKTWV